MWTQPKNVVKTGFPGQPYKNGQKIASICVCISYKTGLPLYYQVTIDALAKGHNFLTFEEAMIFCDVNGYWVDTFGWDDPIIGLNMFYTTARFVRLDNGQMLKVDD